LPPEEAGDLFQHADTYQLAPIMLMTPTTSTARLQQVAHHARGFVYCVARKGVTGYQTRLDQSLGAFVARCRHATSFSRAGGYWYRRDCVARSLGAGWSCAVRGALTRATGSRRLNGPHAGRMPPQRVHASWSQIRSSPLSNGPITSSTRAW
jgi:tryptophan synthase alpha chain